MPRSPVDTGQPLSKLRANKRRGELLAAARRIFGEFGYEAATVKQIVEAAGVAQGTFYLYFPAKKDALVALRTEFHRQVAYELETGLEQASTPDAQLAIALGAASAFARRQRDLLKILQAAGAFSGPDSAEPAPHARVLAEFFGTAHAAGRLVCEDAPGTAAMVAALWEQVAFGPALEGEAAGAESERTLVRFVQRGLGLPAT